MGIPVDQQIFANIQTTLSAIVAGGAVSGQPATTFVNTFTVEVITEMPPSPEDKLLLVGAVRR